MISEQIQAYALKAWQTLECEGLARVDFFVSNDQQIFLNEINTLPGFTTISMYPKLWQAGGITYSKLLDQLILLAVQPAACRWSSVMHESQALLWP